MTRKLGEVLVGDCVDLMAAMPECSVDAIVTDPPYGLEFMGKEWDKLWTEKGPAGQTGRIDGRGWMDSWGSRPQYAGGSRAQAWHHAWAVQALRVLKPGGHCLAFGGTRTFHRLTCALEDAGFEIRDCLMWLYGSGFPKSLDVSKAIDKAAVTERNLPRHSDWSCTPGTSTNICDHCGKSKGGQPGNCQCDKTGEAITDAAREWDGWGTALKPAWEPIVLARKPLAGTVATNVQEHGTGALNIGGCRIAGAKPATTRGQSDSPSAYRMGAQGRIEDDGKGRWPPNVALDEVAAQQLDQETGSLSSGPMKSGTKRVAQNEPGSICYGTFGGNATDADIPGDSGGASRFMYCAKAGRAERNAGLSASEEKPLNWSSGAQSPGTFQAENTHRAARNHHPTVKPINLMRWLVRLVTPPGGTVLDPFLGSGTTACACEVEGVAWLGLEKQPEYAEIARARAEWWRKNPDGAIPPEPKVAPGQETMF